MFSSSWSMPLFTFLLGMLVIRLFWKRRHSPGETPLAPRCCTPPCSHNQCYPQQLLRQHSPFCLQYHFYLLYTFTQAEDWAIRKNRSGGLAPGGGRVFFFTMGRTRYQSNFNLLMQQNGKLLVNIRQSACACSCRIILIICCSLHSHQMSTRLNN